MFHRKDMPDDLFALPELDLSDDLFSDPVHDTWFRLGAWSSREGTRNVRFEEVIRRESILVPSDSITEIYSTLDAIGNQLSGLGEPTAVQSHSAGAVEYAYMPFYEFDLRPTSVVAEPLVFMRHGTLLSEFIITPDMVLFLGLEEQPNNSQVWIDPRHAIEVLRVGTTDSNARIVEIRTRYLLRYLQARQKSLIVGHYRERRLNNPTPEERALLVGGEHTLELPNLRAKAIIQDVSMDRPSLLLRRLHLWLHVTPPEIDIDDPWREEPTFDVYAFTLPTRHGEVAPARFRAGFPSQHFAGVGSDFMDHVYFDQEVLKKYETTSGFLVEDDGSVHCHSYWGLYRSTRRIGNDLLSTSIGDFAEGVPLEEWPHWKQYATDPPTRETYDRVNAEKRIPDAVNDVVEQLELLDRGFAALARAIGLSLDSIWRGALDSLAGRHLKWVYSSSSGDDEFLTRATLLSTLVLEGLAPAPLRSFLRALGPTLHENEQSPPRPLGARNLLQRTTLIAAIALEIQPDIRSLADLVRPAERIGSVSDTDLQSELETLNGQVRKDFAPLAFLYDLRTFGGLAHQPNRARVGEAVSRLGLPMDRWRRGDYLALLRAVKNALNSITTRLYGAARIL